MERKIIGLTPSTRDQILFALLDDGNVLAIGPSDANWKALPPIPQLSGEESRPDEMSLKELIMFLSGHKNWEVILKGLIHQLMSETPNLTEGAINSAIKNHPVVDGDNSDLLNLRLKD